MLQETGPAPNDPLAIMNAVSPRTKRAFGRAAAAQACTTCFGPVRCVNSNRAYKKAARGNGKGGLETSH